MAVNTILFLYFEKNTISRSLYICENNKQL